MVSRIILAAALLAPLAGSALAGIAWKPRPGQYEVEGIRFPLVIFQDGANEISYAPPVGWVPSGEAKQASFKPPGYSQAEAVFSSMPAGKWTKFDPAALNEIQDLVLGSLPDGSSAAKVESAIAHTQPFSDHENCEIVVSYVAFGQHWMKSIFFCRRGEEIVRFELTTHYADFPPLAKALRSSLFSMQGL